MLIITADRRELVQAIQKASVGLPSRPAKPVLAGILIRSLAKADRADDVIRLTASDSDMTFTAECKADIHTGGEVLLPGRMLTEVSKYFTGSEVTVDYQDKATA